MAHTHAAQNVGRVLPSRKKSSWQLLRVLLTVLSRGTIFLYWPLKVNNFPLGPFENVKRSRFCPGGLWRPKAARPPAPAPSRPPSTRPHPAARLEVWKCGFQESLNPGISQFGNLRIWTSASKKWKLSEWNFVTPKMLVGSWSARTKIILTILGQVLILFISWAEQNTNIHHLFSYFPW